MNVPFADLRAYLDAEAAKRTPAEEASYQFHLYVGTELALRGNVDAEKAHDLLREAVLLRIQEDGAKDRGLREDR